METKIETFYTYCEEHDIMGIREDELKACISRIEPQIKDFVTTQKRKEKKTFTPISVSDMVVQKTFARTVLFQITE